MIKHISRVVIGSLGLSVVFVQGLQTQPVYNEQSGLASAFELVAIDSKARAIVSRDHYGSLGIAGVSIFLFDISPGRSESSYFGRQVMLQVQAGAGTWHQKGSLANDITVEFFEIGMKIPVSPLFQVSGFSDNVGISVLPTLGFPSMRNYNTGNFSGVLTRGIGVGLDVKLFEFMTASLEYQWTTVNRKPFLWSDVYETLNLGLSFGLGRELSNIRESHEYNDALRQRTRVTEDSLVAMHEKLRDAQKKETKDSPALASVVQNLVSEIQSLRNELSASQRPSGGDSFAGSNGQNATFTVETPPLSYDKTRLPAMTVVRLEKKIFEGGDLVEEDYLKNILAVMNNYDQYAWEIVYRDADNSRSFTGLELAGKIRSFFEIYNSKFNKKFQLVHDAGISSEFELRCLGMLNP